MAEEITKFMYVNRRAPYGTIYAWESLEVVLIGAAFDQDELIQTWVVHHLQIIGEASRGISQSFRDQYPTIPWTKIVGMRNILVHF